MHAYSPDCHIDDIARYADPLLSPLLGLVFSSSAQVARMDGFRQRKAWTVLANGESSHSPQQIYVHLSGAESRRELADNPGGMQGWHCLCGSMRAAYSLLCECNGFAMMHGSMLCLNRMCLSSPLAGSENGLVCMLGLICQCMLQMNCHRPLRWYSP